MRQARETLELERKQLLDAQRESEDKIRLLGQEVAALRLKDRSNEVPVIKSVDVIKTLSTPLGKGSFKTAWLCEWRGKRVVKLEFSAGDVSECLRLCTRSNSLRVADVRSTVEGVPAGAQASAGAKAQQHRAAARCVRWRASADHRTLRTRLAG